MKNQNQIPVLFVAFSHTLTQSQIDGFKNQYGVINSDNDLFTPGEMLANIITLKDVAPELQAQMSQIPATATLLEIQELAKAIVAEAVKAGATHFFITGEPTLTMWTNLYAGMSSWGNSSIHAWSDDPHASITPFFLEKGLVCIQSTTERRAIEVTNPDGTVTKTAVFQHVQWREMF